MDNNGKWNLARKKGLCYGCLKAKHVRYKCKNSKKCSINGCEEFHHQLLDLVDTK